MAVKVNKQIHSTLGRKQKAMNNYKMKSRTPTEADLNKRRTLLKQAKLSLMLTERNPRL